MNDDENSLCISVQNGESTVIAYQKELHMCQHLLNDSKEKAFNQLEALLSVALDRSSAYPETSSHIETVIKIVEVYISLMRELQNSTNQPLHFQLLASVANILNKAFTHCKNSESTYGKDFGKLAFKLKTLFHKSFALQASTTALIGKLTPTKSSNNEMYDKLIEMLYGNMKLARGIDQTAAASSFKLLLSVMKNCEKFICLPEILIELLKQAEKIFDKISKMCSTQTSTNVEPVKKILTSQCKLGAFYINQITLVLSQQICYNAQVQAACCTFAWTTSSSFYLMRKVEGWLVEASKKHLFEEESLRQITSHITGELLTSFHKLIAKLIESKLVTLEGIAQFGENYGSEEKALGIILVTLSLIGSFKHVTDGELVRDWLIISDDDNTSIFGLVFAALPQVKLHVWVGTQMYGDDGKRFLYEMLSACLCSLVVVLSSEQLRTFEVFLLRSCVDDEAIRRWLAADLWSFLARLSTPELCWSHVTTLVSLVRRCESHVMRSRVATPLSRIARFLPERYQRQLAAKFQPSGGAREHASTTTALMLECLGSTNEDDVVCGLRSCLSDINEGLIRLESGDSGDRSALISLLLQACAVLRDQSEGSLSHLALQVKGDECWRQCCQIFCRCDDEQLSSCLVSLIALMMRANLVQPSPSRQRHIANVAAKLGEGTVWSRERIERTVSFVSSLPTDLDRQLDDTVVKLWSECHRRSIPWLLRYDVLDRLETFSRLAERPDVITRLCAQDQTLCVAVRDHLKQVRTDMPHQPLSILRKIAAGSRTTKFVARNAPRSSSGGDDDVNSLMQIMSRVVSSEANRPNAGDKIKLRNLIGRLTEWLDGAS